VLFGYTLAADANARRDRRRNHQGLAFWPRKLPDLGGDASRIWCPAVPPAGHLTRALVAPPRQAAGLIIIYDLERSPRYLNVKLGVDLGVSRRTLRQTDAGWLRMKPLSAVSAAPSCRCCAKQTADLRRPPRQMDAVDL